MFETLRRIYSRQILKGLVDLEGAKVESERFLEAIFNRHHRQDELFASVISKDGKYYEEWRDACFAKLSEALAGDTRFAQQMGLRKITLFWAHLSCMVTEYFSDNFTAEERVILRDKLFKGDLEPTILQAIIYEACVNVVRHLSKRYFNDSSQHDYFAAYWIVAKNYIATLFKAHIAEARGDSNAPVLAEMVKLDAGVYESIRWNVLEGRNYDFDEEKYKEAVEAISHKS